MIISWSASISIARMRKLDCSLEDFMDIFKPENVRTQPTKDGHNYVAGQLLDYTKSRGKGNVIDRCAVVLDCDDTDAEGVKGLVEGVRQLGVRSVVHSTYSSTPDKPRVRVVIPLKDVVVPGDYTALCNALMNHLDMVIWDESCAQAERAMYMPAKPEGGEYWAVDTQGPLMDGLEWLKAHEPKGRKARTSKGNIAKKDRKRKPENDPDIRGAFNRVYTIADAIEEFDLPYEPCREGRWTYYGSHTEGGLRLVEGREDLCISEHANTDPACFVDGNGSVRALSAFELCAIHLCGDDDDTSVPPRERASMQKMAKRAGEDERVRAELKVEDDAVVDVSWLKYAIHKTRIQAVNVAAELRDTVAYVKGIGWLVYAPERGIWRVVDEESVINLISRVVESWCSSAVLSGEETFAKKVDRLCHRASLRHILGHLSPMLALCADDFDADLDLLCVRNGVVDLRTRKLMPHDPRYRMTRRAAVAYREGATHESWTEVLEALNPPERSWSQQWFGCALTGHQPRDREASIPILSGVGSNGKSVLIAGVKNAMGDYACGASQDLLMPKDRSAFKHAAVALKGRRFVVVEELPDGVLSGNAVKMLACTPTMMAEAKYQMEFEFKTTHSLMVTTNTQPRVDEGTDGVNRRLAMLPFPYHYVDSPKPGTDERLIDDSLVDAVETEEVQEAILAWMIEGAYRYYAAGKHVGAPTEDMRAAKAEWLGGADVLAAFYDSELVEDPKGMIPWTHLCAAFTDWSKANNGKPWNSATLKNRVLSHRMFSKFKCGKIRTTGMSLYRDKYGNGPDAPTGTQVAGMRGVRFRTPADGEPEAVVGEYVEPELPVSAPEPPVVEAEPEPEALIAVEDVPAPTACVAPEKGEVERRGLVEEINGLVEFVQALPDGVEEVDRLVEETGCRSPREPLGKLRAFKMRLEGALVRLSVQHRKELGIPFAGGFSER